MGNGERNGAKGLIGIESIQGCKMPDIRYLSSRFRHLGEFLLAYFPNFLIKARFCALAALGSSPVGVSRTIYQS